MSSSDSPVYNASFIRKSLAAVSKTSARRPILQPHRIFNLHLARLGTFSSPRPGPKLRQDAFKQSQLLSPVDPDGSTSLAEDNSLYNEQDSLDEENIATKLPPGLGLSPSLAATPPSKFVLPIKNANLQPAVKPLLPKAPPLPPVTFQPRPGNNLPLWCNPGNAVTHIDKPSIDDSSAVLASSRSNDSCASYGGEPSLDQDDSISTSTSSASGDDQDASQTKRDRILAQLDHILAMDDALLANADLPGLFESIWATCPTPPPSPNCSRPLRRLNRKASHALLNYLLLECGYDLASLRKLEAHFPVPLEEGLSDTLASETANEEITMENRKEDAGPHSESYAVGLDTMVSVLDDILQTLGSEPTREGLEMATPELGAPPASEGSCQGSPQVSKRLDLEMTVPRTERTIDGLDLEPAEFVSRTMARQERGLPAYSKATAAPSYGALPLYCPPLTRSRSLSECWTISAFTVCRPLSPQPSPTPAPAPKPKAKVYMHTGTIIESCESVAAPLQSGHAYVRANITQKMKTKTRPDAGAVRPETETMIGVPLKRTATGGTLKKQSLIMKMRNGFRHDDALEQSAKPGAKWLAKVAKMSKSAAQGMRVLAKNAPNTRGLAWKDFVKIMMELGFEYQEMDGRSVKFYIPNTNEPTIIFPRPGERVCHIKMLANMRKKLADTYGWIPEDIIATLGDN
ncbi:hypothetical protein B0H16DRAFT_925950 [Mycena metata]|uniref:Uncharacterized protein n=1 Tax=Mycena metata TaxID=1033252 RepID=A0AAD7IR66_9AGAR|nr:hypothetical protein B0H16DRAFT_925950 [Mycena metata]